MKTTLILCILSVFLFISCEKEKEQEKEPVTPAFSLKPDAMVSIKPASSALKSVSTTHLTDLEIVKQTTIIQCNFFLWGEAVVGERGFQSNQRDTVSNTPCLKMYGLDIINQEGNYVPEFIESTDCILIKFDLHAPYGAPRDTLAYIPNATLRAAESLIKQAYETKDMELILNTFNEAFTFIPITGAEYKALKAQNLQ